MLLWTKKKPLGYQTASLFANRHFQPSFQYFNVRCSSKYSVLLATIFYCRSITVAKLQQHLFTYRRLKCDHFCLRRRNVFRLLRTRVVMMGLCFFTHYFVTTGPLLPGCLSPRNTQISLCFPLLTVVVPILHRFCGSRGQCGLCQMLNYN